MKTINCVDDFIKMKVHIGEPIIYKNQSYYFKGLSPYKADLKDISSMLTLIPKESLNVTDPYVGKRFIYRNYEIEVLQKNKNGNYSVQAYDNGKKYGSRFALLPQDMSCLVNV